MKEAESDTIEESSGIPTSIKIHTTLAAKAYFLSLLISNNLTLGGFLRHISEKAAKSYKDNEEVREAFRQFLTVLNPKKFSPNKTPSKARSKQQLRMEEMYREVTEKEQGWSKDELKQLYELFEEIQEELCTEVD